MLTTNCTGCGACLNVCPKQAIGMQQNEKGFYNPVINEEICIKCGLCNKVCPINNYKSENIEHPTVYAFQNQDKDILFKCASGGAFASIAKYVIKNNGIVYGVVYDENMKVCHSRTDNLKYLEKMYSSKYVQSDTKDTYKLTKVDLENGRLVLYSGTPCQIAGLKSFLRKDYENLITVDIVCHGVPSPLVFELYKKEISKFNDDKILNIDFRNKNNGWNPYNIEIKTIKSTFVEKANKNDYFKLFLSNLNINSSCNACQFNKLPRTADLSLADFWGVDEYDKNLNDNRGLSIILLNNTKGIELLKHLSAKEILKEIPLEYVILCNKNICSSSTPHKNREKFFIDIKNGKSLKQCVKKYAAVPIHLSIYRILPKFIKNFIKYKILKMEKYNVK